MNRLFRVVLVGAVAGGAVTGAAPADASPAAAPVCTGTPMYYSAADLDGDSHSDVVVGVPKAESAGHYAAGVVDVHYGPEGNTRTQRVDETRFGATAANFDNFGAASSFLFANDDQCSDLAIGAPRADGGRGTVTIALGSNDGISTANAIILTGRSPGEQFGSQVVAYDNELFVSAPERMVDGIRGAGAVDHYQVTNGVATLVQSITENTPGIHGGAETNDNFGRALSVGTNGPLVVGEPAEDVGTHAVDAGTVTVAFFGITGRVDRSATYSQNSTNIPGVAESGDHFGASVTSPNEFISVGVPGEALGSLRAAGTVDRFESRPMYPKPQHVSALSQNSPGVPGVDEAGDHFGKQVMSVAGGLCIGVPSERIDDKITGDVLCVGRHQDDSDRWDVLRLGTGSLGGRSHGGAQFGAYLSTLPFTDMVKTSDDNGYAGGEALITAVPGVTISNEVGAGQVRIESRTAYHDSAGPMAEQRYGVPTFVVGQGPRVGRPL